MREEPREERALVRGQGLIAVLAACALATACNRPPPPHGAAAHAPATLTAYLTTPQLVRAARQGGSVVLSGIATAGAAIRLASPDGSAIAGPADRAGAWRLAAPAGPTPRLYSLSETIDGRLVRATGYIAVLPSPGPPAVMLHPSATASLPPADAERGVTAVDYDASGVAMVSGRLAPGENVRLLLDGKEAGGDRADARGAFSAVLSQPLAPGGHVLAVSGQPLKAGATFVAVRPVRIAAPPFDARRLEGAWRIDWMTPAGGVQSTVLFDRRNGRP